MKTFINFRLTTPLHYAKERWCVYLKPHSKLNTHIFQYMRNHPTIDEEEVIKAGQELFDTVIDTMRKYQKIEQILDDCDLEAWEILEKVKEVVEDGNDTTNTRSN